MRAGDPLSITDRGCVRFRPLGERLAATAVLPVVQMLLLAARSVTPLRLIRMQTLHMLLHIEIALSGTAKLPREEA